MANPTRITKGDGIIGSLNVTNDLSVGTLTVNGGTTIKKISYGTVDIDLPAINATSTGSATGTITGVTQGDMVMLMTPTTFLNGVAFTGCLVTDDNELTVYAINATSGTQNASSKTIGYIWFDLT